MVKGASPWISGRLLFCMWNWFRLSCPDQSATCTGELGRKATSTHVALANTTEQGCIPSISMILLCPVVKGHVVRTKSPERNAKRTMAKPRLLNLIRNDKWPCNHDQLHYTNTNYKSPCARYKEKLGGKADTARRAMHKATEANIHRHYTTDINTHKQCVCVCV
jgi:hypothetical protein